MKKRLNYIFLSSVTSLALLMIGCGPDSSSTETAVPEAKLGGWYGKTLISATDSNGKMYKHDTAGIFGKLIESSDAKDKHDIKSYGPSLLQIVFPQTEWDVDNGYYFSDYHHFDENSEEKSVWTFQIRHDVTSTNLKNAPITIKLDGIYDVNYKEEDGKIVYEESSRPNTAMYENLTLIDVDNGTSYSLEELSEATLNMDGHTVRTFRWVFGTVDSSDYEVTAPTQSTKSSSVKEVSSSVDQTLLEEAGKFGLPPQ